MRYASLVALFCRTQSHTVIKPGTRVTVYLKDVPKEAAQVVPGKPFVVFSLLQHEHKKTVLNFTVQRNTEYEGSVRSKVRAYKHTCITTPIDYPVLCRIPSYSASGRGDSMSTLYTANTCVGVARARTTCTSLSATCGTVSLASLQFTGLWYMANSHAHSFARRKIRKVRISFDSQYNALHD